MTRGGWVIVCWLALVCGAVGCSENEKATAQCKGMPNGQQCTGCCNNFDATGVMVNGVCSCRGGK